MPNSRRPVQRRATDRLGRVTSFIAKRQTLLANRPHSYSKLRVILAECGWKQRGASNLAQIQSACEAAGIYPEPMLTAPGLDWEETIYFSRVKPARYEADLYSPHPSFMSEQALQRFLARNLDRIPKLAHLKTPVLEYRLPSGGRIDILCREKRTNAYVVIELKKFAVNPVPQTRRYLVEVERELASQESQPPSVKGIIITGRPSAVLERTLPEEIRGYEVSWLLYRVKLELVEKASSGIPSTVVY